MARHPIKPLSVERNASQRPGALASEQDSRSDERLEKESLEG
jgi:hypothetical protein